MEDSRFSPPALQPEDENNAPVDPAHFPMVGIAASDGGLPALLRLVKLMPSGSGMGFVVILHSSLAQESDIAGLMQTLTSMPVRRITEPAQPEPDHVYVLPPDRPLVVEEGKLHIADAIEHSAAHAVIDLFFRTLADAYKDRAYGIALSGANEDGAAGLLRIKGQGGITLAQAPYDAEHDAMPRAAIEAGAVDLILPIAEMPAKLLHIRNAAKSSIPPDSGNAVPPANARPPSMQAPATEAALREILLLLNKHTGHDFRSYKRATILRRIERRMQVCGAPDLAAYRDYLRATDEENNALLQDLLIGVTNFFRDQDAFEALSRQTIPRLFDGKQSNERVRVWSAACSTGEEAYSLAMLLTEEANRHPGEPDFQVFATDIDAYAIASARAGLYPESIEADVTAPRLRQFFAKESGHYHVKKALREKLLFAQHNLLKDSPFSRLDLITCRNFLIYLDRDMQARLIEMFHFALKPGGYLFLGSSETANIAEHLFIPVDNKNRIYRAREVSHAVRSVLRLPANPSAQLVSPAAGDIKSKPGFSLAQIHQRALMQASPPSIMVDRDLNIVHMTGNADHFLRFVGGEPSRSLPLLVLPPLRLELNTALLQAFQTGASVHTREVTFERESSLWQATMAVRPFHDDEADADFALVIFDKSREVKPDEAPPPGDKESDPLVFQLEQELLKIREQLQDTIERSGVSTEELKASNEELQAINEELRSATEELETSKEELQSTNEELVTVNSELKLKVEETRKINDDLNNLIASTDIATIFVDSDMRIQRYTPSATDIFNLIASDINRSLLDITHRLRYAGLADDVAGTLASLQPRECEVRSTDDRVYLMRILPYRTTDDRIGGTVLAFIDITSRHRAEEQVKAGERRFQLFAESTKDYAIITSDTTGLITSWNQGAERMFGYREEEALGQPLDMICLPDDAAAGTLREQCALARSQGRAEDERWYLRKDGGRVFCSGMLSPLEHEAWLGYAMILRDMTERVRAEQRREAQLAREKAAREDVQAEIVLKDQFLAVMSHELKQPLNLIQLNAEMLMRLPEVRDSAAGIRAVTVIRNTVSSQAKIIDDLLDLSRLHTGKLTLARSEVDLAAIVNAICEAAQADMRAGSLELALSGTDAPIPIHADALRMEQVIWNLITNAMKFTPAGGRITVSVTVSEQSARLYVSDTGCGIAPEFQPYVFDIYRQAVPSSARPGGGLGIGLSLVKQLVGLHGGHAEVASDGIGKGSRFSIWLPLQGAPDHDRNNGQSVPEPGIFGLRILLMDDVEETASALKSILEFEGAAVFTATSTAMAMDILAADKIDLVACDVALPGTDGYAFIAMMRNHPATRHLPAIAITGMGRESDVRRALQAGFSAHIGKPVPVDELIAKIRKLTVDARSMYDRGELEAAQE